jgi:hypothetical protein
MMPRRDDWIDDDEYPDERDMRDLGDDAPYDDDPLTIGRVKGINDGRWTRSRIILVVCALILLVVLAIPILIRLGGG